MVKSTAAIVFAAATMLVLLYPQVAQAACCMNGAVGYPGSIGIGTCADGPCPTGSAAAGFVLTESKNPNACCNKEGNADKGIYHNGAAGTPGCFWPTEHFWAELSPLLADVKTPCTGQTCDASAEPVVCGFDGKESGRRHHKLLRY